MNNPCNPTGAVYSKSELEALAKEIVKQDIYCISDEVYEYFVYDTEFVSAAVFPGMAERTIVINGFSKSHCMTGWRIGYTGSSVEIAKLMSAMQSHATSNPNSIAQFASVEALTGPQDDMKKMKDEFDKRRVHMYERVKAMPYVDVMKPEGAFYLFIDMSEALKKKYKGDKLETSAKLAEHLLNDYAVAVIPCADFGFPTHIRLSYAISMEQIDKGLDRIEAFLKELN